MKINGTLLLIAGVIVALLLLAGLGYKTGAFSITSVTPTPTPRPTPSLNATPTPTVQPTKALPTTTPTTTPTVTATAPLHYGVGFSTINYNPAPADNGSPAPIDNGSPAPDDNSTPTATPMPTPIITPTGDINPSSTLDGMITLDATYTVVNSQGITVGLTGLPYDDYQVTAYLIGYDPQTQTVTVNDASVPVTFAFVNTTLS